MAPDNHKKIDVRPETWLGPVALLVDTAGAVLIWLRHSPSYEAIFFSDTPMTPNGRCKHRFAGVCTIILMRAEGGHVARCLICDVVGQVRGSEEDARRVLSDQTTRDEE